MATDKVKRIPQLPAATTLGDADLFLVHQNNASKKVTFSTFKTLLGSATGPLDENSVDIRINNDNIQWQFNGGPWYNLITLTEIKQAAVPEISFFNGDGHTLEFGPIPGLVSDNPNRCQVVVGGVVQQPTFSYTLSLADGGKLIFPEAPPTVKISIQPF
jgi:hypothetical protein